MDILLLLLLGPYLIFALPAYILVRFYGRPFHVSDLVALFAPYVVYQGLEIFHERQGANEFSATPIVGCAVAICVLFRGSRQLSPWAWAVGTSLIGSLVSIIVWRTVSYGSLFQRMF